MHCTKVGSYTSIDMKHLELCATQIAPNNCPVCLLREENDLEAHPRELRDEYGNPDGVAFAGTRYHLEDFVHYRAEYGPANIGYITNIEVGKESKVTVRKVGRIPSLGNILPEKVVRDEVCFSFANIFYCLMIVNSFTASPLSNRGTNILQSERFTPGHLCALLRIVPRTPGNTRGMDRRFLRPILHQILLSTFEGHLLGRSEASFMGRVACLHSMLQGEASEKIQHEEVSCWCSRKTIGCARPFWRGGCL